MEGDVRQQGRLPRIAATMLNLAALAERAALRSLPVRFLVLTILWHAEAIARKFVASEMDYFRDIGADLDPYIDEDLDPPEPRWPSLAEILPPSGFTLDANLLALRLRMLAAILVALAEAGLIWEDDRDDLVSAFGDWPRQLLCAASTATALPLFLVIVYPVARHGVIRPPDTS